MGKLANVQLTFLSLNTAGGIAGARVDIHCQTTGTEAVRCSRPLYLVPALKRVPCAHECNLRTRPLGTDARSSLCHPIIRLELLM
jgi:hypothetical protein